MGICLLRFMNDPEYELYVSGSNGDFFKIYTDQEMIPVKNAEKGGELLAAISLVKGMRKNLQEVFASFNGFQGRELQW
jgi:hypothetical protein